MLLLPWIATVLQAQEFSHFEARHVHPVGITPGGMRLLAVNSPDAALSVFDISNEDRLAPMLIREIPVGLEPVSVRARTDDEVWVVNEVSDSISVVSLREGIVIDTLQVKDEPADVHFAGGKAFVSCSANRMLRVFDAATREPLATIPLQGVAPRAITSSADGSKIYVAFLFSGNGTTILPRDEAPAQPQPTNPDLPAPPQTAQIVPADDTRIRHTVLDHDVAEIDVATLEVTRYLGGAGTHLFDLAIRPGTDDLWIANSESLNLIRHEPNLRGIFSRHRLTEYSLDAGAAPNFYDLNPEVGLNPNVSQEVKNRALAQPTALVFAPGGESAWVAAFNSDRLAKIELENGAVTALVDVRLPGSGGSRDMRGPRGMVLSVGGKRLYSLNKFSNTISTINTETKTIVSEVPVGSIDPTPAVIREGRGFIFDARLSGTGMVSCATCHLDSDRDGIAWDQGDPGGEMVMMKGADLSLHDYTLLDRWLHPMKGPMVTQTLIGMAGNVSPIEDIPEATVTKFHWRGDKPSIQSFNSTFDKLMGGDEIPAADMDALAAYLLALRHHPNPNQNPDRSFSTSLDGGNAVQGRLIFMTHAKSHCIMCHTVPSGTDQNIDSMIEVGGTQFMKNPSLRTVYQRANLYKPTPGAVSLSGFGLGPDGTGFEMPKSHFYQLDNLVTTQEFHDVTAFVMSFDTGTAPAVGRSVTVDVRRKTDGAILDEIALLEARARAGDCDLVVRGRLGGLHRGFRFVSSVSGYLGDRAGAVPMTRAALLDVLDEGEALAFMGVLPGNGMRLGADRNLDGTLDGDDVPPSLTIRNLSGAVELSWPGPSAGWFPETSVTLDRDWVPMTRSSFFEDESERATWPISEDPKRFFRLRSTR